MDELDFPRKLLELGDKDGAAKEISRLLMVDHHKAEAWILLAQAVDDLTKKADCYRQVLRFDPNNKRAQTELQNVLLRFDKPLEQEENNYGKQLRTESLKTTAFNFDDQVDYHREMTWRCPSCDSQNQTPVELFTETTAVCPKCSKSFKCITGKVVRAQCLLRAYHFTQYFEWVIRLEQQGDSVREIGFTLLNEEFTIANGDMLIILLKTKWGGQDEVVYIENKITQKIIKPRG